MKTQKRQFQNVIITGGSSGIGKALAKQIVQSGSNLAIIARTQAKLDEAIAELTRLKVDASQVAIAISADVSDRSKAVHAIESAINQIGVPDLLITCAGIARPGYFKELALDIFEETMAINYFGSLYCVKAALPSMASQRSGRIVLVSSGAGLIGLFGYTPYSPSKFAVRGLAESLRGELKSMGIGLSIVYPPDTDTPQLAAENRFKPPETKKMTAMAECLSADQVAQDILVGIRKNQFVIAPGMEMTLLARLHSLVNPILQRQFDGIVAKMHQK
ncbi:MAG: SDR family oxidoreductase [Leptolyngbyaceae cyanobacterium MO_188.B28]|nr:SDR family oxidoreductase [Leptolyngbyaceae cyanobacterium MO_188.B28]